LVRFRPCAELALTPSTASLTFRPLGLQQTLKCPFYPCFFSQYIGPPSPRQPSRSLAVWPPLFPASAAPHLATPSEPARCPLLACSASPASLLAGPCKLARRLLQGRSRALQGCSPPPSKPARRPLQGRSIPPTVAALWTLHGAAQDAAPIVDVGCRLKVSESSARGI
jgi:hypothetical protein